MNQDLDTEKFNITPELLIEYEKEICIMVLGGTKAEYIVGRLEPRMFTNSCFKKIISVCKALLKARKEINLYTVMEGIPDEEQASLCEQLVKDYIIDINCDFFIDRIIKCYLDRITERAKAVEDLKYVEKEKITYTYTNCLKSVSEQSSLFIKEYEENSKNPNFIHLGYDSLDGYIGGLRGGDVMVLAGGTSMGKAFGLNTNVLTNKGWVKNKDLKIGDKIICRDGKETKIIGIFPQGFTNNYKVTLKDGREIKCCEDHLWTVYYSGWKEYRTLSTKELYKKTQCKKYHKRLSLPKFTGEYGEEKDFEISPYILGVLLGDGCLTAKGLTYCKPSLEVFEKVKTLIPNNASIHFGKDGKQVYITNWDKAIAKINQWGLRTKSYDKFIPKEYFHSSKSQREDLLQGLLDTDGYNTGKGYEFSTSSKQLADDVQQLAWSLGYNCRKIQRMGQYKKDGETVNTRLNYRLYITNCKPITIYDIEPCESEQTQCIAVDNEEKLFVIEDYIVTHNTCFALNVVRNIQKTHKVNFYSLEMSEFQLVNRLASIERNLNAHAIRNYQLTEAQYASYKKFIEVDLKGYKLNICQKYNITIEDIIEYEKKSDSEILVIDYLGLLGSRERYGSRYERVTDISRRIKLLANDVGKPIILLHQLSRKYMEREDKRPILSDLRESGAIEQDADYVLFVHRPGKVDDELIDDRMEIIIAKNRHGECDVMKSLIFNGATQKVTDFGTVGG